MHIVFILGAVQAFFLCIIAFSKKQKTTGSNVLAGWMLIIGIHLAWVSMNSLDIFENYPYLYLSGLCLPMVQGPILFIYTSVMVDKLSRLRTGYLFHLLPYFSLILYLFFELKTSDNTLKYDFIQEIKNMQSVYYILISILNSLLGPIYTFWAFMLIKKHNKIVVEDFSNIDDINLAWLKNITIAIGTVWVIVILTVTLSRIFLFIEVNNADYIIYITLTIVVFFMGFYGLRQPSIYTSFDQAYSRNIQITEISKSIETKVERYQNAAIIDDLESHVNNIVFYMENEKPYLESKLSLRELAEKLELTPNTLSQIINENLNQNFFDFVNNYRVQEVKDYFNNPKFDHYTLLAIAYDCGFNSKSSFNRIFKETTGFTPSEFQKNLSLK